jgi:hypothetical protein
VFPRSYTHAHVTSDYPIDPVSTPTFTFDAATFVAGQAAKSSNVTGVFYSVDPNFHRADTDPKFSGKFILVDGSVDALRANCPRGSDGMTPRCTFSKVATPALADGMHKVRARGGPRAFGGSVPRPRDRERRRRPAPLALCPGGRRGRGRLRGRRPLAPSRRPSPGPPAPSPAPPPSPQLFLRTDSFVDAAHPSMQITKLNGGTFSAVTLVGSAAPLRGRRPGRRPPLCAGAAPARESRGVRLPAPAPRLRGPSSADPPHPPSPRQVPFWICTGAISPCGPAVPTSVPDEPPPQQPLPGVSPPGDATLYKMTDTNLPNPNDVLTKPYDCSGWLGQRYYLEGQTWHTPAGASPNTASTQLHVGACLPHKQLVAGVIPLDLMVGKFYFAT